MTADTLPEQKIHALFYKALKPITGHQLKPSDITIAVETLPTMVAADPTHRITVDLSKTSLAATIACMTVILSDGIDMLRFNGQGVGTVETKEHLFERLQHFPVRALQSDFADTLMWKPDAKDIVAQLVTASQGRSAAG